MLHFARGGDSQLGRASVRRSPGQQELGDGRGPGERARTRRTWSDRLGRACSSIDGRTTVLQTGGFVLTLVRSCCRRTAPRTPSPPAYVLRPARPSPPGHRPIRAPGPHTAQFSQSTSGGHTGFCANFWGRARAAGKGSFARGSGRRSGRIASGFSPLQAGPGIGLRPVGALLVGPH